MLSSWLSSFLSDYPSTSKYQVGEPVDDLPLSIFNLHTGSHKETKQKVSVFVFDRKKHPDPTLAKFAAKAAKNAKCIKHPSFLNVLDVIDVSSGVYIVTDEVTRLTKFSKDHHVLTMSSLPYNLRRIIMGLDLLHTDMHDALGNLCPDTIYVDQCGYWHSGILETLSESLDEHVRTVVSGHPAAALYESTSPYCLATGLPHTLPVHMADRVGLGAVIGWLYAKSDRWTLNINIDRVSTYLEGFVREKLTVARGTVMNQINWKAVANNLTFISDLILRSKTEIQFFFTTTLPSSLKNISPQIQTHMILPQLSILIRDQGTSEWARELVIGSYCQILSLKDFLSADVFFRIWPALREYFACTERSIRFQLLVALPQYSHLLTAEHVKQILTPILLALKDTSVQLRDITLKMMLLLVPSMGRKETEMVVKSISVCVDSDDAEQIRTNAVVCLVRLAANVEKCVLFSHIGPALITGTKDRSHTCRFAAVQGIASLAHEFTLKDLCLKYLPAVAAKALDTDISVQRLALEVLAHLTQNIHAQVNLPPLYQSPTPGLEDSAPDGYQSAKEKCTSLVTQSYAHSHTQPLAGMNTHANSHTPANSNTHANSHTPANSNTHANSRTPIEYYTHALIDDERQTDKDTDWPDETQPQQPRPSYIHKQSSADEDGNIYKDGDGDMHRDGDVTHYTQSLRESQIPSSSTTDTKRTSEVKRDREGSHLKSRQRDVGANSRQGITRQGNTRQGDTRQGDMNLGDMKQGDTRHGAETSNVFKEDNKEVAQFWAGFNDAGAEQKSVVKRGLKKKI